MAFRRGRLASRPYGRVGSRDVLDKFDKGTYDSGNNRIAPTLIQRGRGTGPMKPQQPAVARRSGAKSGSADWEMSGGAARPQAGVCRDHPHQDLMRVSCCRHPATIEKKTDEPPRRQGRQDEARREKREGGRAQGMISLDLSGWGQRHADVFRALVPCRESAPVAAIERSAESTSHRLAGRIRLASALPDGRRDAGGVRGRSRPKPTESRYREGQ
jgi:hypothetical protein